MSHRVFWLLHHRFSLGECHLAWICPTTCSNKDPDRTFETKVETLWGGCGNLTFNPKNQWFWAIFKNFSPSPACFQGWYPSQVPLWMFVTRHHQTLETLARVCGQNMPILAHFGLKIDEIDI